MNRRTAAHAGTVSQGAAEPRRLLDFEQAGRQLGVSGRLVRKLVDQRELASVKIGALVRIEPSALDEYVARRRRPARNCEKRAAAGSTGPGVTERQIAPQVLPGRSEVRKRSKPGER